MGSFEGIKYYRLAPTKISMPLDIDNVSVDHGDGVMDSPNYNWKIYPDYIIQILWEEIRTIKLNPKEYARTINITANHFPSKKIYVPLEEIKIYIQKYFEEIPEHEVNAFEYGLI